MDGLKLLKSIQLGFILDQPGYGVLSYKLKPLIDNKCPTAYTDGKVMAINETFLQELSADHRKFVYAHELLHCAFLHPMRRGNRDPKLWNMACDYAVNIHLKDAKFSVPDMCLIDEKYRGKAAEIIYNDLMQNPQKSKGDKWNFGDVKDGEDTTGDDGSLEQEWKVAAVQAANAQKQFGKADGMWEGIIESVTQKKLGFEGWLYRFMSYTAKQDYNRARFNRRKAVLGMQLPGLRSMELGTLAIAIDSSASIDDKLLGVFLGKIERLRNQFPCKIHTFMCDTKVMDHKVFDSHEALNVKVKGRGGTDFRPVFNMIRDEFIEPDAIIYFTDLEGTYPTDVPKVPVLWVGYGNSNTKPPFGDVVRFEE